MEVVEPEDPGVAAEDVHAALVDHCAVVLAACRDLAPRLELVPLLLQEAVLPQVVQAAVPPVPTQDVEGVLEDRRGCTAARVWARPVLADDLTPTLAVV